MGEPGTKEVLRLEDLEAAGNIHTGRKHVLSVLVENKPGVLTRVAGLFARRGFNIDTLAVGPTEDESVSRVTITLDGASHPIDQVTKQLHKLVNVIKIRDLEPEETIAREMALFKVSADGNSRAEIMQLADIFRGRIIDVSSRTVTIESPARRTRSRASRTWCARSARRDGSHGRDRDRPRQVTDVARGAGRRRSVRAFP